MMKMVQRAIEAFDVAKQDDEQKREAPSREALKMAVFLQRMKDYKLRFGAFACTMTRGTNGLTRKTAPAGYTMRVYDSSTQGTRRRTNPRRRIHVIKDGHDVVLSGRQLRILRKRARVLARRGLPVVQHQDDTTT